MENVASRFGQRLAHTEKKYRDQALKKLTAFLTKRAEWSDLEWDKLWKALFYCMWMSDKRPVQDELSTNLAALVHTIPSIDDALGFVHSFFRTMHREWHGIDGLRLDKFYSLIRKFVHQTLLLLENHEWQRALVERFVSILSSEVMSQLPNGLRLHTTDLFLTELHGAGGETVDTETFLLLLEPFFTLLSSEYDKTVFKRVRELVFLPLLNEYKFGAQPPKKAKKSKKNDNDETDCEEEEEEEEEVKVFEEVELPFVQHRIFAIASADDTAERNRSVLYELYSHFFKVTKIDSLKANQDENNKPKKSNKKRKQPDQETEAEPAAESDELKKKKKNKRRKKSKKSEEDVTGDVVMDEKEEEEETPAAEMATPEKKSKKAAKTPMNTPVKAAAEETPTKKQKKAKATYEVVTEAAKALESTHESAKKTKKAKKDEAEASPVAVEEETPTKKQKKGKIKVEVKEEVVETPSKKMKKLKIKVEEVEDPGEKLTPSKKQKQDKKLKTEEKEATSTKKAESDVVVRSGMKFRRCAGCGGLGKGLVPVGKDCCRHCERTGAKKKKEQAADKKKRKAEVLAAATVKEEIAVSFKKVTFGKNRALPHELSVKRLKASKAGVKELTSDIKGVLKAGSGSSPATIPSKTKSKKTSGRMKAADFF